MKWICLLWGFSFCVQINQMEDIDSNLHISSKNYITYYFFFYAFLHCTSVNTFLIVIAIFFIIVYPHVQLRTSLLSLVVGYAVMRETHVCWKLLAQMKLEICFTFSCRYLIKFMFVLSCLKLGKAHQYYARRQHTYMNIYL